jgi:hypothetical protein
VVGLFRPQNEMSPVRLSRFYFHHNAHLRSIRFVITIELIEPVSPPDWFFSHAQEYYFVHKRKTKVKPTCIYMYYCTGGELYGIFCIVFLWAEFETLAIKERKNTIMMIAF